MLAYTGACERALMSGPPTVLPRLLSPLFTDLAKTSKRSFRLTGVTRGRRAQRPGDPIPVATDKSINGAGASPTF